jgi:acyl carrier protein
MSLENDLKQMIVRDLKLTDVDPDKIADGDALFGEGLGLDSLDAVELVMLLQKNFKVDIKDMDEARAAFVSIKTLADYIRVHGAAA